MREVTLELADEALAQWGQCVAGGSGLGHASCSSEQKVNAGYIEMSEFQAWPEDVQVCERAVLRMPGQWRYIAMEHYAYGCGLKPIASNLRVSLGLVKQRIGEVRAFVAGALMEHDEKKVLTRLAVRL